MKENAFLVPCVITRGRKNPIFLPCCTITYYLKHRPMYTILHSIISRILRRCQNKRIDHPQKYTKQNQPEQPPPQKSSSPPKFTKPCHLSHETPRHTSYDQTTARNSIPSDYQRYIPTAPVGRRASHHHVHHPARARVHVDPMAPR